MGGEGAGLVRAGQLILLVSAVFEPLRLAVQPFVGDEVGGVGGWGGLTNIGVPEDCQGPKGRGEGWCFKPGVFMGLSPFGLAFVLAWAVPSVITAAIRALGVKRGAQAHEMEEIAPAPPQGGQQHSENDVRLSRLLRAWSAISVLWFVLPLVCFSASPFYRTSIWKAILGLSLIASYPLSWHLALVALPVSELVAPNLSLSDPAVKTFHKALGWRTAGWAALHGGLELIYLLSKGLPEHLNVVRNPENWMYLLGLVALVLMAVHCLVALLRKQDWLRARFRAIHGIIALVLLACATAHWPPFALLMVPAAAAHGGGVVKRAALARGMQLSERRELLAMAFALTGGLLGLLAMWVARERALGQPTPDVRLQHVFPPLALMAEGLGGLAGASVALMLPLRDLSPARDELLAPRQSTS